MKKQQQTIPHEKSIRCERVTSECGKKREQQKNTKDMIIMSTFLFGEHLQHCVRVYSFYFCLAEEKKKQIKSKGFGSNFIPVNFDRSIYAYVLFRFLNTHASIATHRQWA